MKNDTSDKSQKVKVEKSAGAIIFRDDNGTRKYLLLHYNPGHWEYVKGHIEDGETTEHRSLSGI